MPLRHGATLVAGELPSYVHVGTASREVGRSRLRNERTYLVISTGGKWGYDHDFETFLAANAPVLEDAVFYVMDEYASYVREWRIANGELTVELVAPDNSHVGLVLVEQGTHRDFGLALLEDMLDDILWGGGAKEEPGSIRFRAVMALVQYRPERWQTWYQLGLLQLDYAPAAAREAFERAFAIVPGGKRSLVEVADLRALEHLDLPRALAFGRARADAWLRDALADQTSYWSPIAAGLERLAELERDHGAPALAARAYLAWLRASDGEARSVRLYNLACLRARAPAIVEARDWLRAAVLIDPALAATAATDPDLAACGDLAPLLDADRDPG